MRGLNRSIVALLALLLILCIAVPEMADAAMLRQGSSGEQVKMLQSKLKRWGYYNGNVDGIFGSGTAQAVKYFQKKNGLTADGIVGEATAKALGLSLTVGRAIPGTRTCIFWPSWYTGSPGVNLTRARLPWRQWC